MIEYNIEILTVNDKEVKFDSAYLTHNDDLEPQSWSIEIFGTNNDRLFEVILEEKLKPTVKIGTMDGSGFVGEVIIKKYTNEPLGSTVLLEGKNELVKVQAAPK